MIRTLLVWIRTKQTNKRFKVHNSSHFYKIKMCRISIYLFHLWIRVSLKQVWINNKKARLWKLDCKCVIFSSCYPQSSLFLFLQQTLVNILVTQPKSSWGPMIASAVMKKPVAQMKEKASVVTMKIPNCWKKMILAKMRKHDDVHVVKAPEVTEIPTWMIKEITYCPG